MKYVYLILFLVFSCSTSNESPVVMNNDNSSDTNTNNDNTDNTGNNNSNTFVVSYHGNFVSSAHETSGVAEVNENKTVLRFTNFKTSTGPVLDVYLATDETAGNYVDVGTLQGIEGDYEYSLPGNINYETYKYVIIWCVDFSVNFGYAVLSN